ncbi:MAG: HAMP domain-containing histidine kinase [Cytophagaceae bacterium]|nr:HAMP domain-containing histidine kinase [Cytophagaceae bacterium]
MKLIHKTSQYYLVYTLSILSAGTVAFYLLIKIVLMDSIDEALHQEEIQIIQNLAYEKDFDSLRPSENIYIRKVRKKESGDEKYTTIQVYDTLQNLMDYRQLKKVYQKDNKYYEITVRQSMGEAEALLSSLIPAVVLLFLIILTGVLFMNNYVSRKVWKPFYDLIEKLRDYDPLKTKVIKYEHSEISEFNELNLSVEKMTHKIYQDFLNQKEFNENSSHEMQTPVAIIRNKLELLIQSGNLKETEMQLIESIFEAAKRLSLLNRGLLLISKIENQQFSEIEKVEMQLIVQNCLKNFDMQIEDKNIKTKISILNPCSLNFNIILADILVSNLVSNAIRHNKRDGKIYVELTKSYLKIENTGTPLKVSPEVLFERFRKNSDSEYSIGLGLSIVKKICDAFNFRINYVNEHDIHSIVIEFL